MAADDGDDNPTYDWSAYYDDSGALYYYNNVTEESSWDAPAEGFNPPPPPNDDDNDDNDEPTTVVDGDSGTVDESMGAADGEMEAGEDDPVTVTTTDTPVTAYDDDPTTTTSSPSNNDNNTTTKATPWIAYQDEEGNEYYFNQETNETQWEKPAEGYQDASALEEAADGVGGDADITQQQQEYPEGEAADDDDEPPSSPPPYLPSPTSSSPPPADAAAADDDGPRQEDAMDVDIPVEPEPEPEITPLEAAQTALGLPDSIMERRTAIDHVQTLLEELGTQQGASKAMTALVQTYTGQTAMCGVLSQWTTDLLLQSSSNNNNNNNKTSTTATNSTAPESSGTASSSSSSRDGIQDWIRGTVSNVITKMALERFTKEAGDDILKLQRKEALFLREMMSSQNWRRLLIDLSAKQVDSTLLKFCLSTISKQGHHREIIQRINPSNHFAVFNAMLTSELAGMGRSSSSGGGDDDDDDDVALMSGMTAVEDLTRTCISTSYTYLYSMEVLRSLLAATSNATVQDNPQLLRQRRKWLRFKEDLETAMMGVAASTDGSGNRNSSAGGSALFRKRRLDVALTLSELSQSSKRRKRQRHADDEEDEESAKTAGTITDPSSTIATNTQTKAALMTLLRKHALGTTQSKPLEDSVLNQLLPPLMEDDTNSLQTRKKSRKHPHLSPAKLAVGTLLLSYPLSMRALMEQLFCPGQRSTSLLTRSKCAQLLSLGILTAEQQHAPSLNGDDPDDDAMDDNEEEETVQENTTVEGDESQNTKKKANTTTTTTTTPEEELKGKFLLGSQSCELLENMVSFVVSAKPESFAGSVVASSAGMKLCRLALDSAPVAQGVLLWAYHVIQGPEFVSGASYPTLSPSILSLVRILALQHAFTRPMAAQIALVFLGHSNPGELSSQKMRALKEQSLRLLLHLFVAGEVALVLRHVQRLVERDTLDSSLVRYFVGNCLLTTLKPPFSMVLTQALGQFLLVPKCIDALQQSTFFGDVNKRRLQEVIHNLPYCNKRQTTDDEEDDDEKHADEKKSSALALLYESLRKTYYVA